MMKFKHIQCDDYPTVNDFKYVLSENNIDHEIDLEDMFNYLKQHDLLDINNKPNYPFKNYFEEEEGELYITPIGQIELIDLFEKRMYEQMDKITLAVRDIRARNASTITHDKEADQRNEKWKYQIENWGFADYEVWNLDQTIAQFIYPRLLRFKDMLISYPPDITYDEWKIKLDRMIKAFELIIKLDDWGFAEDEDKEIYMKSIDKGLKEFANYLLHMWD